MTEIKSAVDNAAPRRRVGRFAPTPSGDMHFGNLLCALVAYLSVKKAGGDFLVRIEDLDVLRCPRSSAERILGTLDRFGLAGDAPPIFQSERGELYAEKLRKLEVSGLTYPCFCSRAQLHAAEAPRQDNGDIVYNGTCRRLGDREREELIEKRKPCTRVVVPDTAVSFTDGIYGETSQNLARDCGDFIVRRSDGVFAYQFAVAIDDCETGVTEVVRGDDLLYSTPRQIYIMNLLGYTPPSYAHIPLVTDSKGRKLSKSEGDHISDKLHRLPPERILGALGYAAGILPTDRAAELAELVELFDIDIIKKGKRNTIRLPEILDV